MRTLIHRYTAYIKTYVSNLIQYNKYHIEKTKYKTEKGIIFIDIKSNVYRRHLANLIFWFVEQGYEVQLKNTFKALGSMKFHVAHVFKLPGFKLVNSPKNTHITLTSRNIHLKADELYLNSDYFINDHNYHVPLGMHPDMYFKGYYKAINHSKKRIKRHIRIFFSGNMNPNAYNRDVIGKRFNKLSRDKIAKILLEDFPEDQIRFPSSGYDLENGNQNKVVFNDKNRVPIAQKDFLPFLSNCHFFLCTPGVIHPICHNNFEAMSVGTILILQYPEFFYPKLEDGKNCLVFKDENDLISVLEKALTMPEEKIKELRNSVIDYFNQNLTSDSIIDNIFNALKKGDKMIYLGLD